MSDFYRNISREYDFWPFLGPNFEKIRVPSENIDDFPSIDLYMRGLAKSETCLRHPKIRVLF